MRAITLIYSKIGVYIGQLMRLVQFYCDQDLMTTTLYSDSTIFNSSLFQVSSNFDQFCWLGLANNAPMYVTTTIPSGGPYKFSVYAQFGSGDAEQEQKVSTVKKNQQFISKIPIIKTPHSLKTTKLPEDHPYVKPSSSKTEPQIIEASGNVTGTYQVHTLPWPSYWKVFLSQNLQATSTGDVFQFELAADPATVDESQYAGSFSVADFFSTGNVVWYNFVTPHRYTVNPDGSKWFAGSLSL